MFYAIFIIIIIIIIIMIIIIIFFCMLCCLCTKILNHNLGSQYTKYHTYTVIQVFFHFLMKFHL